MLSKAFVGTSFDNIDGVKFVLSGQLVRYESFVLHITNLLSQIAGNVDDMEVAISSVGNLFRYEEFNDVSRVQSLLRYIEEKENLLHLFNELSTGSDVEFKIGSENDADVMQGNSLLGRVYPLSPSNVGKVALIAPVRMDYRKSANALVAFTDALSRRLGKER